MPAQLACLESILGSPFTGQPAFTKVDLPKMSAMDKLVKENRRALLWKLSNGAIGIVMCAPNSSRLSRSKDNAVTEPARDLLNNHLMDRSRHLVSVDNRSLLRP
jgi:hypothetical protein